MNIQLALASRGLVAQGRRQGKTLLEVSIVVAIMGIVAMAATPKYHSAINNFRVDAAANRIASDLAYVKRQAMAISDNASVQFSPNAETYTVTGVPSLDRTTSGYTVNLTVEPYRIDLVSASFGGSQTVTFNRFGAPNAGGSLVVGGSGYQRTITVNATSGRTTIQ